MTTIAYCRDDRGTVWLATDKQYTRGARKGLVGVPKAIAIDVMRGDAPEKILVGACGDLGSAQLIFTGLGTLPPLPLKREDDQKWISEKFVKKVLKLLAAGPAYEDDDPPDFSLLLVVSGEVYDLDRGEIVAKLGDDFGAIGSGSDYACGAMATMHRLGVAYNSKFVSAAVRTAAEYDTNTDRRLTVLSLPRATTV